VVGVINEQSRNGVDGVVRCDGCGSVHEFTVPGASRCRERAKLSGTRTYPHRPRHGLNRHDQEVKDGGTHLALKAEQAVDLDAAPRRRLAIASRARTK
jgi:hypothetical protein